MKYRFTMDHFQAGSALREDVLSMPIISVRDAVMLANLALEQWEKESESIYLSTCVGHWHTVGEGSNGCKHTREKAILWNPRKIGEKGEGE